MFKIDKMAFFVHANQKYTATHCSRTGYRNAIAPAFGGHRSSTTCCIEHLPDFSV